MDGCVHLKVLDQKVCWASKQMPVFRIACHFGPGEGLNWHSSILELEVWCDIDCVIGHPQCVWPEIWSDGTGPPVVLMDEHCAHHLLKFLDLPLCNTVLMGENLGL